MLILVVDDDALAGEMTAALLEESGYPVVLAGNGIEALEVLQAGRPVDLVVSDMHMPLMSGIELFRELRGRGLACPFLLLTGDDPVKARSAEPALDGCLAKDETLETSLGTAVAALIGGSGGTK